MKSKERIISITIDYKGEEVTKYFHTDDTYSNKEKKVILSCLGYTNIGKSVFITSTDSHKDNGRLIIIVDKESGISPSRSVIISERDILEATRNKLDSLEVLNL